MSGTFKGKVAPVTGAPVGTPQSSGSSTNAISLGRDPSHSCVDKGNHVWYILHTGKRITTRRPLQSSTRNSRLGQGESTSAQGSQTIALSGTVISIATQSLAVLPPLTGAVPNQWEYGDADANGHRKKVIASARWQSDDLSRRYVHTVLEADSVTRRNETSSWVFGTRK